MKNSNKRYIDWKNIKFVRTSGRYPFNISLMNFSTIVEDIKVNRVNGIYVEYCNGFLSAIGFCNAYKGPKKPKYNLLDIAE